MSAENKKRIAIFGASGVAGGGVLSACLAAPEVASIVAVTRRPLERDDPKLREILCEDFSDLSAIAAELSGVDACFYCLGTSSSGVDEAKYRVITKDYALEAARTLKAASPSHSFLFISGGSTSLDSRFMWARVKAETEEALKALGLAGILCLRPGMIISDRAPSMQSWVKRAVYPLLRLMRFVPAISIEARALGSAMVQLVLEGQRAGTLENRAIRAAAERYRPDSLAP